MQFFLPSPPLGGAWGAVFGGLTAAKIAAIIRAKPGPHGHGPANRRPGYQPGGVQKGEVNMDEMTTREVDRLADWLRAQGFSAEQVLECVKYITGTNPPAEPEQ